MRRDAIFSAPYLVDEVLATIVNIPRSQIAHIFNAVLAVVYIYIYSIYCRCESACAAWAAIIIVSCANDEGDP